MFVFRFSLSPFKNLFVSISWVPGIYMSAGGCCCFVSLCIVLFVLFLLFVLRAVYCFLGGGRERSGSAVRVRNSKAITHVTFSFCPCLVFHFISLFSFSHFFFSFFFLFQIHRFSFLFLVAMFFIAFILFLVYLVFFSVFHLFFLFPFFFFVSLAVSLSLEKVWRS